MAVAFTSTASVTPFLGKQASLSISPYLKRISTRPLTPTCWRRPAIICASNTSGGERLSLPPRVRAFALMGGVALTIALVNRVANTPFLTAFQARADIISVVCGVSLLVYAAGAVEVTERGQQVALQGVTIDYESTLDTKPDQEARFVARAALNAVNNFRSAVIFVDRRCVSREGLFRQRSSMETLVPGEAVCRVVEDNKLAYFADLRVMPTREIEFGFLPKDTQAVVAVPVGSNGVAVFGADKVRPLTGTDFGWLTAICNRLGDTL